MLRYFRINDPYRLLSLLVLMILASLPVWIDLPEMTAQEIKDMVVGERVTNRILYVDLIDRTPPLLAVVDGLIDTMFGRSLVARRVIALALLFFQAAYFGILLINNRAYNENTYVPSLIAGLLFFFSFDMISLTPELLASTLLLLALNNVFKEIEFRVDRDSILLNLGIFIGLASLIVFSYSLFLIGAILVLVIFARTAARKIFLMLLGYGLVHAILFTGYYFLGHAGDLWRNFYLANLTAQESVVTFRMMLVLGAIPLFFFVVSLFMLTREARFTRYQSQIFQVLFIWMLLAAIQLWIGSSKAPHAFIIFLPPLAYYISHYLVLIRRRRIAEVMLWIFLLGLMLMQITSRQGRWTQVDYAKLFAPASPYAAQISGKRVMVIGDDPGLYRDNTLGGSFLDWDLSKEYLEHPDFYENLIRLNNAFAEDPPEVIVDELNYMEAIFARLPKVRQLYRKEGSVYWRR